MEIKVWKVPDPVEPSKHEYKYSLFYGRRGERLIGYDNERGKGDHMHVGGSERPYVFRGLDQLLNDFFAEVRRVGGEP